MCIFAIFIISYHKILQHQQNLWIPNRHRSIVEVIRNRAGGTIRFLGSRSQVSKDNDFHRMEMVWNRNSENDVSAQCATQRTHHTHIFARIIHIHKCDSGPVLSSQFSSCSRRRTSVQSPLQITEEINVTGSRRFFPEIFQFRVFANIYYLARMQTIGKFIMIRIKINLLFSLLLILLLIL